MNVTEAFFIEQNFVFDINQNNYVGYNNNVSFCDLGPISPYCLSVHLCH